MFLRISSLGLVLSLAACSSSPPDAQAAEVNIPCALAGAKTFTSACGVERSRLDGKVLVIVRHPDGGFRRLEELDGGRKYAAADGFDQVAIEANGAEVEVTLGEDHYLFPAPATPGSTASASDAAKP